jgi:hypothetical protein
MPSKLDLFTSAIIVGMGLAMGAQIWAIGKMSIAALFIGQ